MIGAVTVIPPGAAYPAGGAPPTVRFDAGPTAGVAPLLVSFSATVTGPANTTLIWSFGDGSTVSGSGPSILSVSHWYYRPGSFSANCTAEDLNGSSTVSTRILVSPLPVHVDLRASVTTGVAPLTVSFSGNASGGSGTYDSFDWNFGDGNEGLGVALNYTYGQPGRYLAVLNVTDSSGLSGFAHTVVYVEDPVNQSSGAPPGSSGPKLSASTVEVDGLLAGTLAAAGVALYFGLRRRDRWEGLAGQSPGRGEPVAGPSPGALTRVGTPEPPAPGASGPSLPGGSSPGSVAPSRPTGAARRLADRILAHLDRAGPARDSRVAQLGHTQAGIAEAVGSQQNVVSKVLLRLVASGAVEVRTRHVPGQARRMKTYVLTPYGAAIAGELRRLEAERLDAGGAPRRDD